MAGRKTKAYLASRALTLARLGTPRDTGNLAYNATTMRLTRLGFAIDIDLTQAYYAYYLQKGMGNTDQHQNYINHIDTDICAMVADYFHDKKSFHNRNWARKSKRERELSEKNLESRELRRKQSMLRRKGVLRW